MYLLFALNLFVYVILECYYPIYLSKRLHLKILSPIIIVTYTSLPIALFKVFVGPLFMLDGGLMDKYFNFAILMTNIALIGKYFLINLSLFYFQRTKWVTRLARTCMPHWNVKRRKMFLAAGILFVLAVLCFVFLASHSFGIMNWISDPRTGYQFHRTGAGVFFALSILFYSTSYSIFCVYLKRNIDVIKCICLFIAVVYLLGSKEVLLSFGVSGLVFLWFRQFKYLFKAILLGLPCVLFVMLLNFGSFTFSDIASYFDYYVNSAMYYEEYFAGKIELFYGKVYWSSFWGVVPRGLCPDKPYVYGILLVNEHFFPGMAEATNTPAFGGPVANFADWGVLGVMTSSFFDSSYIFHLYLYYYLFTNYEINKIRQNPALLYCLILLFAPAFLRFIGFPLSFMLWLVIVKIISWSNRMVMRYNNVVR